jgi:hypothetical protein
MSRGRKVEDIQPASNMDKKPVKAVLPAIEPSSKPGEPHLDTPKTAPMAEDKTAPASKDTSTSEDVQAKTAATTPELDTKSTQTEVAPSANPAPAIDMQPVLTQLMSMMTSMQSEQKTALAKMELQQKETIQAITQMQEQEKQSWLQQMTHLEVRLTAKINEVQQAPAKHLEQQVSNLQEQFNDSQTRVSSLETDLAGLKAKEKEDGEERAKAEQERERRLGS